ncbi:MAG: peptide transporter ATP-binding protein [Pseudomonadota bacterium]|jgi:oligopeptide transport system ATP-binding protein
MAESNDDDRLTLRPSAPEDALLHVDHLTKVYAIRRWLRRTRFLHALTDVSLYLARGETLGIVGETGSGKSSLAKIILRLLPPTLGQIVFAGRNITEYSEAAMRPLRRRLQPIFQDPNSTLNPRLSVGDIIAEGLRIHHLRPSGDAEKARVLELLGQVGLAAAVFDRLPGDLSAGERQRVAIARALAVEPELLICDEPVSALDVSVQAQIANLLLDLQQEFHLSYLFISHDLKLVCFLSHRIAVMYMGRIVETGPSETLAAKRSHPYTRALFNAVPEVLPTQRRLRILLDGEPPDPFNPPAGCAFHPRCPQATPGTCDQATPPLEEWGEGSGHFIACFNPHT